MFFCSHITAHPPIAAQLGSGVSGGGGWRGRAAVGRDSQGCRAQGLKVALLGWVPCSEGELSLCTPTAVLLQEGTCNSILPLSEAGRGSPGTAGAQRLSPGSA